VLYGRPPRNEAKASVQSGRAGIDVSVCSACGGPMKIIVGMPNHSIEDPIVIGKILSHLEARSCTLSASSMQNQVFIVPAIQCQSQSILPGV